MRPSGDGEAFAVPGVGDPATAWVDLYWLPLGAGGRFVRRNGQAYEWWMSRREHRRALDLYHCGLMVRCDGVTHAVEMGPVWNVTADDRGVLCEGPVGARWLGRFRPFRYEVRCWAGGSIPDLAEAVESPTRTTDDPREAAAVLGVLPEVPALTWGRDEIGVGEMWNSNSIVAWALARAGHDMDVINPPSQGRLPGWAAGVALARRQSGGAPTYPR